MNNFSFNRRILSCVLKGSVIISALIGIFASVYLERHSIHGGSRVFMYFTTQSNIAMIFICGHGFFVLGRDRKVDMGWAVIKLMGTVSITLTGVVFAFILAPVIGDGAWNAQNTLTHLVVPVISVLDFFVVAPGIQIPTKYAKYVMIPPIIYVIYAGIGYLNGWQFSEGKNYPYFFLNWGSPAGAFGIMGQMPFLGTVWWLVILLFFLYLVGHLYIRIADRIYQSNENN